MDLQVEFGLDQNAVLKDFKTCPKQTKL